MIGHLQGTCIFLSEERTIIDVNGVGYEISAPTRTLANLLMDKEAELWIHTVVREDALDLYGFDTLGERDFFELLLGVSGIGPKSALGIISIAPTDTLRSAIASDDTSYLTNVSGIGKKTAEKIVLELRDKMGTIATEEGGRKEEKEALEALISLGYSSKEAREALKEVQDDTQSTNEKIRAALKTLGS
ncbi:MAG: Holliday junction branch migration protein RuvA [Candidatus Paceibacterota bacterium]